MHGDRLVRVHQVRLVAVSLLFRLLSCEHTGIGAGARNQAQESRMCKVLGPSRWQKLQVVHKKYQKRSMQPSGGRCTSCRLPPLLPHPAFLPTGRSMPPLGPRPPRPLLLTTCLICDTPPPCVVLWVVWLGAPVAAVPAVSCSLAAGPPACGTVHTCLIQLQPTATTDASARTHFFKHARRNAMPGQPILPQLTCRLPNHAFQRRCCRCQGLRCCPRLCGPLLHGRPLVHHWRLHVRCLALAWADVATRRVLHAVDELQYVRHLRQCKHNILITCTILATGGVGL